MIKLHPPTTVLIVVSAALTTLAIENEKPEPTNFMQECGVLSVVLDEAIADINSQEPGKPIVFSIESAIKFTTDVDDFLRQNSELAREFSHHPLLPFYRLQHAMNGISPVKACPEVVGALTKEGRISIDHSESPFPPLEEEFSATLLFASVPAIPSNGSEALVSLQKQFGRYDGHDEEIFLKKGSDGRWYIVSIQEIEHPPS